MPKPPKLVYEVVSIAEQQPDWRFGLFDFGKAEDAKTTWFNPGVVEFERQRYLLVRRQIENGTPLGTNSVVAFKLESNKPKIGARVRSAITDDLEQFEDPRGIVHGGHIWISCCNYILNAKTWTGARQILIKTNAELDTQDRHDVRYGGNFNGHDEKNWVWFFHNDKPHMIYSATPHTIVEFTKDMRFKTQHQTIVRTGWEYGEIRGGTPPVRIGNLYWTFFHSSTNWLGGKRRYFMGCYTFEAKAPFMIKGITKEPLLVGSQYDICRPRFPLVVFPCGAILNELGTWFVTLGVNDLKARWCEFSHTDLEERITLL